jgi:hypothetical protein
VLESYAKNFGLSDDPAEADYLYIQMANTRRSLKEFVATPEKDDPCSGVKLTSESSHTKTVSLRDWLVQESNRVISAAEKKYLSSPQVDEYLMTMQQRTFFYWAAMDRVYNGCTMTKDFFSTEVSTESGHVSVALRIVREVQRELSQESNDYESFSTVFDNVTEKLRSAGNPFTAGKANVATPQEDQEYVKYFDAQATRVKSEILTYLNELQLIDNVQVNISVPGDTTEVDDLLELVAIFGVTETRRSTDKSVTLPLSVAGLVILDAQKDGLDSLLVVTSVNPEDQFLLNAALALLESNPSSLFSWLPYCVQSVRDAIE